MTAPSTPQWLAPSAPGQLSNQRGSNTGADAIQYKFRYSNPKGAAMSPSLIRLLAKRSAVSGNPSSPDAAWDSGWAGGQPAAQPMPVAKHACGGNSTVTYNGRMYFMPSDGKIVSAPCQGPAVGTWRYENPLVSSVPWATAPTVYSMTSVANRLYAIATAINPISTQATLYFCTINGDGTLGNWSVVPGGIIIQSDATWKNSGCCGGWDGVSATGFIVLWNTTLNATTVTVNISDGSITATSVDSTHAPVVTRDNLTFAFIGLTNTPNIFGFYMIGGKASAATTATEQAAINPSTGIFAGAFSGAAALPAARIGGIGIVLQDGSIYYIGGSSTTLATGVTNTVFFNTVQRYNQGLAWSTSANTIPTALWLLGGGVISNDYDSLNENANLRPWVVLVGGQTTAAADVATVSNTEVNNSALPHDVFTWNSGAGTAAAASDLFSGGTAATITNNQDGTVDITIVYGSVCRHHVGSSPAQNCGALTLVGLNDGDQLTIQLIIAGTDGDYSSTAITVVKIGQAPTVTGVAFTVNDGRPVLSFNFIPGAGGGPEFSYQITLKDPGNNLLFDSGVRYDGLNSIQTLLAPYLATGVAYSIAVSVASTDSAMSGSSSTGSGAATDTPTLTSPGTPSGLTAVAQNATGSVNINWTNNAPAGTTPGNRVYYRRNGTTAWFLLFDSSAAMTGLGVWDRLALATAYDFAVSQTDNATHAESPLSNVVSNVKIDPVLGGYSGFLHIQGSSIVNAQGQHTVALLVQNGPQDKEKLDMRTSLPFQQLAPVARLGVAHYAELLLRAFIQDLAHLKSLQDVINTSYAGNPIVYRDGFGAMVVVSPMSDHNLTYRPPLYREVEVSLLQVPDSSGGWAVGPGSARGYQTLLNGSAVPLDSSELIL